MLRRLSVRAGGPAGIHRGLSFYQAEHVDVPPDSGTVTGQVRLRERHSRLDTGRYPGTFTTYTAVVYT